jgi:hypothetical protein
MITLSVNPKICIVKAINEIVTALISIGAPRRYRKWLVEIIFVAGLFVGCLDYAFHSVGGGKGPKNEGA